MTPAKSLLIGLAAGVAAYIGLTGMGHPAPADSQMAPMVSSSPTFQKQVTRGAKIGDTMSVTNVSPLVTTLSPVVTPHTMVTVLVTPSPRPSVSPSHSPLPAPSISQTPVPTAAPTASPTPSPTPTPTQTLTPTPATVTIGPIVINEIAWMGTATSSNDEWIELYNAGSVAADLTGWTLKAADNSPNIALSGTIQAGGYYLLERTADTVISDVLADKIYTGSLKNGPPGEDLEILDSSGVIADRVDCSQVAWFAGDSASKTSMERINAFSSGSDPSNWANNTGSPVNGHDAAGGPIRGTPGARNSVAN